MATSIAMRGNRGPEQYMQARQESWVWKFFVTRIWSPAESQIDSALNTLNFRHVTEPKPYAARRSQR
jgi:hypothetical protein